MGKLAIWMGFHSYSQQAAGGKSHTKMFSPIKISLIGSDFIAVL
jgi:hypothetical protein